MCVCVQGPECCSDSSVSFHYITADSMYIFEYFVYHLRPFGASSYSVVQNSSTSLGSLLLSSNHSTENLLKMTAAADGGGVGARGIVGFW